MFVSLVNSRTDLTPGQKSAYLLSCLAVEPRDLLVEFLEEECRLLDKIPRDVRESSGNANRRMTLDQRAIVRTGTPYGLGSRLHPYEKLETRTTNSIGINDRYCARLAPLPISAPRISSTIPISIAVTKLSGVGTTSRGGDVLGGAVLLPSAVVALRNSAG
ncbi:hypothetical protein EVAR_14297_1 [Eumeta japonica]|uniref:Uncharacterized protein n=1 Tax=Eumeta variegata TaxID=151549 RepID=A0A4C1UNA7_EUMVA|nr:hypothetical protein EVAR_14297_1 [Eumeta japonica]